MKLHKQCSCGHHLTTKNVENVSRTEMGLWYTCIFCKSTGIIKNKVFFALMKGLRK